MQNSEPLVPLGLAIIAISFALIVVPYLRRRSDAITIWNVMLMGSAMFMGVGCLEVAYGQWHWPELQWFQPRNEDIQQFILGTIVFYAALFFSYYKLSLPRRIGARFLNKWPPLTAGLLFVILGVCIAISAGTLAIGNVVFVTPFLYNASHKAVVFAVVFSFCYWYRNKLQLPMLVLFLVVFCYACVFSMVTFTGRRLLLSVAVAPLICMYWMKWRYLPPRLNLIRLALVTAIGLAVATFYSTFRHFDTRPDQQSRSFSSVLKAIESTTLDRVVGQITADWMHYLSQYTVHYSLLTIQLVDTNVMPADPLHTLKLIAVYPIPRAIWPEKPRPMGALLVSDVLQLTARTNWGLGIVGYGFFDGGVLTIALYAFLVVVGIRLLDDALARQPDNTFLLAILCAALPHVLTWIRGEIANMTLETAEAVAFAWAFGLIGRFFIGTERTGTNVPGMPPVN